MRGRRLFFPPSIPVNVSQGNSPVSSPWSNGKIGAKVVALVGSCARTAPVGGTKSYGALLSVLFLSAHQKIARLSQSPVSRRPLRLSQFSPVKTLPTLTCTYFLFSCLLLPTSRAHRQTACSLLPPIYCYSLLLLLLLLLLPPLTATVETPITPYPSLTFPPLPPRHQHILCLVH